MKILIIGSKGMLGQMCQNYFGKRYDISCFDERYSIKNREGYISGIKRSGADYVLLCAGGIPQNQLSDHALFEVNAILPIDVGRALESSKTPFIYPSTDCIFNGRSSSGFHEKNSAPSFEDSYGASKYLGERSTLNSQTGQILRCSVIGPDSRPGGRGLWNWVQRWSDGEEIKGYANHFWNGITTLYWCQIVEKYFFKRKIENRLVQIGTTSKISKHDLIHTISTQMGKKNSICKYDTEQLVDKTLMSDFEIDPFEIQFEAMFKYKF